MKKYILCNDPVCEGDKAVTDLQTAHAQIQRLRDDLVIYGVHLDDCEIKIVGGKCTCGYLNALAGKNGGR